MTQILALIIKSINLYVVCADYTMAVFSIYFSVFYPVEKEEALLYTLPQSCYHRALPLISACDKCLKLALLMWSLKQGKY